MLMEIAMQAVGPYLNKIPEGMKAMATEYGVDNCSLLIKSQTFVDDKGKSREGAVIVFVYFDEGTIKICRDKEGNAAEYPIEKLLDLVKGGIK